MLLILLGFLAGLVLLIKGADEMVVKPGRLERHGDRDISEYGIL